MPDLQDFSVARDAPANVNVPTHTISGKLQEGATVLADFTGANAIRWPSVLATLSPEQQDEIANDNAGKILQWRANLP